MVTCFRSTVFTVQYDAKKKQFILTFALILDTRKGVDISFIYINVIFYQL